MRVLFIIPHPEEAASGRFRVLQYVPWLQRQGIVCEVRPFMSPALYRVLYQPGKLPQKIALSAGAILKRLADVARSARADVVVVHREALPLGVAWLEQAMARLAPAVVFDFDDAIYLNHASRANSWTRVFRNGQKTAAIASASTHVIAGNRVLEAYARRYNPQVTVIPTPVDTDKFRQRPSTVSAARLVIGWIGSHTTAHYLELVESALAAIAQRHPDVEFRVVGAGSVLLRVPRVSFVRWELANEVTDLHQLDIGLMPMPDDEWARGKCGFKALLYMSAGIPVIASPVAVNTEIVAEGVSGFLANGTEEWVRRLSMLVEDQALRHRMGRAGRAIVEERYSIAVQAPRLLRVLQAAA